MSSDLKKLQGSWIITALEIGGTRMPRESLAGAFVTIKGNSFNSLATGLKHRGTIELKSHGKSKTFDLKFTAGPEKGNRNLGIYELDGDRWTICLATRGTKRPNRFATTKEDGFALETLERDNGAGKRDRAKAKTNLPAKRQSSQPIARALGVQTDLEGEWAMLSATFDGVPMDQSAVKWCKRVTRGDISRVTAGPQEFLNARFTIDHSSSPNSIDYENLSGPNKGKLQKGIFELTGKELKLCVAPPGKPRPKEFLSKPGDGRSLTSWRRVKN